MEIKITPFNNQLDQLEGTFKLGNNYYFGKFHGAGIVTEIKSDDKWLEDEMTWISRSEVPFVTALRHVQINNHEMFGPNLVYGGTPFIRRFSPYYKIKNVHRFPSKDECMQLIYQHSEIMTQNDYHFYKRKVKVQELRQLYASFDYANDLFIRAGTCLYKANILLNTSGTFAEEIYVNAYIALESIIEHLKLTNNLTGKSGRKKVIKKISKLKGARNFEEYEEEMRDAIRNDIIHPYRDFYAETIAKPFLMADYVFEDLAFIDWLFKVVLLGNIK